MVGGFKPVRRLSRRRHQRLSHWAAGFLAHTIHPSSRALATARSHETTVQLESLLWKEGNIREQLLESRFPHHGGI